MTNHFRFPVQTLPMMFVSAILATCAGDRAEVAEEVAIIDQAPAATNNVQQVKVVEVAAEAKPVVAAQRTRSN